MYYFRKLRVASLLTVVVATCCCEGEEAAEKMPASRSAQDSSGFTELLAGVIADPKDDGLLALVPPEDYLDGFRTLADPRTAQDRRREFAEAILESARLIRDKGTLGPSSEVTIRWAKLVAIENLDEETSVKLNQIVLKGSRYPLQDFEDGLMPLETVGSRGGVVFIRVATRSSEATLIAHTIVIDNRRYLSPVPFLLELYDQ